VRALLLSLALVALPTHQTHAPTSPPSSRAFIQVNGYYILYTYPTPPHLSQNGNLLVPLPIALQLLGAHVQINPHPPSATVRFLGSTFTFTPGRPTASFDGQPLPLPEPPTLTPHGALLIPLLPVLQARRVPHEWDPRWRVLRIWEPKLTTTANELFFYSNIFNLSVERLPTAPLLEFVPVRFHVSWRNTFHPVTRAPIYEQSFYTELQHTAGRTFPMSDRNFYWDAKSMEVRTGENVLQAWADRRNRVERVRGLWWGAFVPPQGGSEPDFCGSWPGGRYVCFLREPIPFLRRPGWNLPVMYVLGVFIHRWP